jgi:uncharacterized protein YggE
VAEERWIRVSADGEASVAPDVAIVTLAVSGEGKELGPARDDVNRRSSAVLAVLRKQKIADGDINAPDVGIHPQYDYRKGQQMVGYRVSRQVTVKVRDLDRLGEVLDTVVAAGANELFGAQMSAADPSAAEHAALEAAMAAARAKAEVLAAAADVKLGRVARIEEDADRGDMPMPRMRMMGAMAEAADAGTEVATGDLTVTRSIRAWFELA